MRPKRGIAGFEKVTAIARFKLVPISVDAKPSGKTTF